MTRMRGRAFAVVCAVLVWTSASGCREESASTSPATSATTSGSAGGSASRGTGKKYKVYRGDVLELDITDTPGALISSSAPPPRPGEAVATHPFLSGSAHVATDEGKLRELLDRATSTADFLDRLRAAGFRVEEAP